MGENRKRINIVVIIIAVTFLMGTNVLAQSSKDVYKTLMRLDSATETGVNIRDYSNYLADALSEFKMFKASEGKDELEMVHAFDKVFYHHQLAKECWSMKVSGKYGRRGELIYQLDRRQIESIFSVYPELNKTFKEGGACFSDSFTGRGPATGIIIGVVVNHAFKRAHEELQKIELK
jgi:hypothetical protein